MSSARLESHSLWDLQTLFRAGVLGRLSDGQLLERFLARRDEVAEAAFGVLVARHGAMVLHTCQGVLRDPHDSQDALQATFLVLARRAASMRDRDSVASWLYGVARRVALKAKTQVARRRAFELRIAERVSRPVASSAPPDSQPEVFEEVERLPEKFRAPIILIDLEGCTQVEAAERLRWPLGTVQSRLARARSRLRVQLVRRGLAPSAGLLLATAGTPGAFALPAALVDSTVRAATVFALGSMTSGTVPPAAAALAKGAIKTMYGISWKLAVKWPTGAALAGISLVGAGLLTGLAPASRPTNAPSNPNATPKTKTRAIVSAHVAAVHNFLGKIHRHFESATTRSTADDAKEKAEKDKLKGTWKLVSAMADGRDEAEHPPLVLTFDGNTFSVDVEGQVHFKGTLSLDASAKPKSIDLEITDGPHKGDRMLGIYSWDGENLKWCTTEPKGSERPKDFSTTLGSGLRLFVLKKN